MVLQPWQSASFGGCHPLGSTADLGSSESSAPRKAPSGRVSRVSLGRSLNAAGCLSAFHEAETTSSGQKTRSQEMFVFWQFSRSPGTGWY